MLLPKLVLSCTDSSLDSPRQGVETGDSAPIDATSPVGAMGAASPVAPGFQHVDGAYRARLPRVGIDVLHDGEVLSARDAEGEVLGWQLVSWGRLDGLRAPGQAAVALGPCVTEPDPLGACVRRFEIRRPGITEWWVSLSTGVEQGFEIDAPPPGNGEISIDIALPGARWASPESIVDARGTTWSIRNTVAWDADNKSVPVSLTARGTVVSLRVDDTEAVYPITVDPVYETAAWRISRLDEPRMGFSVSSAGDVDGDGFDDVLVGAPYANDEKGHVMLYRGGADGLESLPTTTLEGEDTQDQLGYTVASAGDVNGDGYGDVILSLGYRAQAFVHHGGPDGLSLTPTTSFSNLSGEGRYVSGAGDVNGDGYDDIILGDKSNTSSLGYTHIHHGGAAGVSEVAATTLTALRAYDEFGSSVAPAGDVNGDGYDDVIVGAPGDESAYVYLGGVSGVAPVVAVTLTDATSGSAFGFAVNTAGDVNGDGYDDVVVGAWDYWSLGMVSVFHGDGVAVSPTAAATRIGTVSNGAYGMSVASAGDANGDGFDDIVIGHGGGQGASVYAGGPAGLSTDWLGGMSGSASSDYSASNVASAGDVNGDGYDDVLHGEYASYSETGGVDLYLGGLGTYQHILHGDTRSLAIDDDAILATGDFDGNGYLDLAVACPSCNLWDGVIYIFEGSATGLDLWSPTAIEDTSTAGGLFGAALATGDVNGDGYDDLAVGQPWYGSTGYYGSSLGRARLYDGSATGLTGLASFTTTAGSYGDDRGGAVAIGDLNGDGFDDLMVGAEGDNSSDGSVTVYLGAASSDPTLVLTIYGSSTEHLGAALASGRDMDGDGYEDLVIGAPYYYSRYGRLYLYRGSASGTPDRLGEKNGTSFEGNLGDSVTLCDVNGDGYVDLAAGVKGYGDYTGQVQVWQAGPSGVGFSASTVLTGTTDSHFGFAVACGGDADGDGTDELLVGSHHLSSFDSSFVFPGSPSGLVSSAIAELTGGFYLAGGDLNGDGYSDMVTSGNDGVRVFHGYDTDSDLDGSPDSEDCDDTDPTVHPAVAEDCDGIDNNCDGVVDEGAPIWYPDLDLDGFGATSAGTAACEAPAGYLVDGADCDDSDPAIHPLGVESCNGADDDCDGADDEPDAVDAATWFADNDGDGHGDASSPTPGCSAPSGFVADATDCDDGASGVHPSAVETCNGLDDDCDAEIDEPDAADAATWFADADADGFGDAASTIRACAAPPGFVADATDCDDGDHDVRPTAVESCNGVDDDCDAAIDEPDSSDAADWFADTDSDGFGDARTRTPGCSAPPGHVADATDCDDDAPSIHPAAVEVCDPSNVDENCDGRADDDDPAVDATSLFTFWLDDDGDGFGDPSSAVQACDLTSGHAARGDDCDDTRAWVHPDLPEVCDALDVDEDCNGVADDEDGGTTNASKSTWYTDADGDGFGDPERTTLGCSEPSGFVGDATDCDDGAATVNPAAIEVCDPDNTDEDCNGLSDDDDPAVDAASLSPFWPDDDGDGHGDASAVVEACDPPSGHVEQGDDCDDTRATVNPDQVEMCDPADQDENCNGVSDDDDGGTDDASMTTWHADGDGDGFGDPETVIRACSQPVGFGVDATDCDDAAEQIHPGADEVCDAGGVDEDCDGLVNDGDPSTREDTMSTWYVDGDGDGYGDPGNAALACGQPGGFVGDATDCESASAEVNPGAEDVPGDGVDQDCDGADADADADGKTSASCSHSAVPSPLGTGSLAVLWAARRLRRWRGRGGR